MEDNKLVVVVKEQALESTQADMLLKKFSGFFEEASKWEKEAMAIQITDDSQVELMSKAREIRLSLRDIRVNADKVRISLKEGIIREGKAIDGVANVIKALIVPLEEHLEKQEKFVENAIKEKEEKRLAYRQERLSVYVEDISFFNLKDMSDEAFDNLLQTSMIGYNKRMEDVRLAEEKRIEEQKKIDVMNARNIMLAPYTFFFDAVEGKVTLDMTEAEFKTLLSKLSHVKTTYDDEQEAIKKENDKLKKEAEEKAIADAKEKAIADAKIKALEKEKADKEAKEKAERDAKTHLENQARLAPEKDKLLAYAELIKTIKAPVDLSKAGLEIVKEVEAKLLAISQEIKTKVKEL